VGGFFSKVMKALGLTKYHYAILVGYLVICPFVIYLWHGKLSYDITSENLAFVIMIITFSFAIFYFLNRMFHWFTGNFRPHTITTTIWVLVFACAFAIPEEIIFRGIFQTSLQNHISSIIGVVLLSSLIFGLAHLPNGANGINIWKWNWQFTKGTFAAGLLLGIIFALTGSLLIPTLLHAGFLIFYKFFLER
jgi:membrane protease YdiL (CAAX protease family)